MNLALSTTSLISAQRIFNMSNVSASVALPTSAYPSCSAYPLTTSGLLHIRSCQVRHAAHIGSEAPMDKVPYAGVRPHLDNSQHLSLRGMAFLHCSWRVLPHHHSRDSAQTAWREDPIDAPPASPSGSDLALEDHREVQPPASRVMSQGPVDEEERRWWLQPW